MTDTVESFLAVSKTTPRVKSLTVNELLTRFRRGAFDVDRKITVLVYAIRSDVVLVGNSKFVQAATAVVSQRYFSDPPHQSLPARGECRFC